MSIKGRETYLLSEYELIDQLHHMPAKIPLLSLLINSKNHRKLLIKIASEAHMAQDITLDKFGGIIGNIMAKNHLTFSKEEIPVGRKGHNKSLHISIKCTNLFEY
ncbi:hypothetical protein CR513_50063, partial [Mucuna pruriens]